MEFIPVVLNLYEDNVSKQEKCTSESLRDELGLNEDTN